MLTSHESFEELCALAAIGQLSAAEFTKLQMHVDICATCRNEYADYQDLIQTRLSLIAPSEPARKLTIAFSHGVRGDDCRQRFIAEARRRGFQFSAEAERGHTFWNWITQDWGSSHKLLLTILVLLVATTISGYRLWKSEARRAAIAAELAELTPQNATLRQQLAALSHALDSATAGQSTSAQLKPSASSPEQRAGDRLTTDEPGRNPTAIESEAAASPATIEAELTRLREEYSALEARAKAVEERLRASASQSETLKSELETSRTTEKQLTGKLQEAERAIKEMTGEVRSLR